MNAIIVERSHSEMNGNLLPIFGCSCREEVSSVILFYACECVMHVRREDVCPAPSSSVLDCMIHNDLKRERS